MGEATHHPHSSGSGWRGAREGPAWGPFRAGDSAGTLFLGVVTVPPSSPCTGFPYPTSPWDVRASPSSGTMGERAAHAHTCALMVISQLLKRKLQQGVHAASVDESTVWATLQPGTQRAM